MLNRITAIEECLTAAFQPIFLKIEDDSARHVGHTGHEGKGHFTIEIASHRFKGLTLLEQHRLVYEALKTLMETDIHALKLKIRP
ncbi:MAG TPA: BolA family protein [Coxiellaceae bacterium]|nr:BolA family protein [Coxiellaceae bacterium]